LKIEFAQSHKLSWCLVGFNGHIVFISQSVRKEGRKEQVSLQLTIPRTCNELTR